MLPCGPVLLTLAPRPTEPPSAVQARQSYNDRIAAKEQLRRQRERALAFPPPGTPRSNPSTVRERLSWLPRQRLPHPLRDLMLAEEDLLAGMAARAAGEASGQAWNRTCGNALFWLQVPPGTPPSAMSFSEAEYRP